MKKNKDKIELLGIGLGLFLFLFIAVTAFKDKIDGYLRHQLGIDTCEAMGGEYLGMVSSSPAEGVTMNAYTCKVGEKNLYFNVVNNNWEN